MKTRTISNVAWVTTIRTFVDGDVFRESNVDLMANDISDRLGYLKAQVDASGKLDVANTWTDENTFSANIVSNGSLIVNGAAGFNDELNVNDLIQLFGTAVFTGVDLRLDSRETLADAADTIVNVIARVPLVTANRVYTLPSYSAGRIVVLSRPRAGDNFTITLQDSGATTLAIIPALTSGWIVAYGSGTWKPLLWSDGITSLLGTV